MDAVISVNVIQCLRAFILCFVALNLYFITLNDVYSTEIMFKADEGIFNMFDVSGCCMYVSYQVFFQATELPEGDIEWATRRDLLFTAASRRSHINCTKLIYGVEVCDFNN